MFDTEVTGAAERLQFSAEIGDEVRLMVAGLLAGWIAPERLAETTVTVLSGGAINRSFVVEAPGSRRVLRIAPDARHNHQTGVDMENSVVVARLAGEAGVGPKVISAEHPAGHSLIEFVPGVLNVDTLKEGARLRDVGLCVRRLHSLPTDGVREKSAFEDFDEWLASAAAQEGVSVTEFDRFEAKFKRTREVLEAVEGRCLSHRDLNPQNCIHTGDRAVLIDWDFSAVDSPYLDLAMLTTYADLNDDEAATFRESAIGDVLPEDVARIQLMRFAHALREWAWCRMARAALIEDTSTDFAVLPTDAAEAEDFYTAYGNVNLEFADRLAADPRFDERLEVAGSDVPAPGFR